MLTELQLQRLYDRVELVPGVGDPRRGQLCIMSFVAFLAGEGHGDMPRTASPLIREFAIPVNDRVDAPTRQRLKPLAPRIIGTADGRDEERSELLYRAIMDEVVPEVLSRQEGQAGLRHSSLTALDESWGDLKSLPPAELSAAIERSRVKRQRWSAYLPALLTGFRGSQMRLSAPGMSGWAALFRGHARRELGLVQAIQDIVKARAAGKHGRMAAAAAHLVLACALGAADKQSLERYCNLAIDLLDRLCDVGAERRAAGIREERVTLLETMLAAPSVARSDAPSPVTA